MPSFSLLLTTQAGPPPSVSSREKHALGLSSQFKLSVRILQTFCLEAGAALRQRRPWIEPPYSTCVPSGACNVCRKTFSCCCRLINWNAKRVTASDGFCICLSGCFNKSTIRLIFHKGIQRKSLRFCCAASVMFNILFWLNDIEKYEYCQWTYTFRPGCGYINLLFIVFLNFGRMADLRAWQKETNTHTDRPKFLLSTRPTKTVVFITRDA